MFCISFAFDTLYNFVYTCLYNADVYFDWLDPVSWFWDTQPISVLFWESKNTQEDESEIDLREIWRNKITGVWRCFQELITHAEWFLFIIWMSAHTHTMC